MGQIKKIIAREILDSRGFPSIEVDVCTTDGVFGTASAPSGAFKGTNIASEFRDGDQRYCGKGLLKATNKVNSVINDALKGFEIEDQLGIDNALLKLDSAENNSELGSNTLYAISIACAKAASKEFKIPLFKYIGGLNANTLPIPLFSMIKGGKGIDNKIDFKEFMIMPLNALSFREALRMGVEIFHCLRSEIKQNGYSTNVEDEGGFSANFKSNEEAIEYIIRAIEKSSYKAGKDVFIAIDAAADDFFDVNMSKYYLNKSTNYEYSSDEFILFWNNLIGKYPIISLEDPISQFDLNAFIKIEELLGSKIQIVGDHIFESKREKIINGVKNNIGNAILFKTNQIGSLSNIISTVELLRKTSFYSIISHRTGETNDTFISDLSVGLNVGQIKAGGCSRMDRISKYNRLMRIEEFLGGSAEYFGQHFKFFNR